MCCARSPMWSCGGGASPDRSSRTRPSITASRTSCSAKQAGSKSVSPSVNGAFAQRAVEAVGPRVVRALQPAHLALGLGDEPRAAVPAGVQERARQAVLVADDDDALSTGLDFEESSAFRHLLDVARADPAAREEVGTLPLQDGRVRERGAGQLRGPLERQQRALDIGGVERKCGVQHGHRGASSRVDLAEPYHGACATGYKVSLVRLPVPPQVWTPLGVWEQCPARTPRKADMSPLLTARPSVSVTLRLLGACAVMAVVAAFVPLAGGDGESSAAVPACLTARHRLCRIGEPHVLRVRPGHRRRAPRLALGRHHAGDDRPDHDAGRAAEPVPERRPGAPDRRRQRRPLPDLARAAGRLGDHRARRRRPDAPQLAHLRRPGCPPPHLGRRSPSPLGDLASSDGFSPIMRAAVGGDRARRRPASRSSGIAAPRAPSRGATCACSRSCRSPRSTRSPTCGPRSCSRAPGGRPWRCAPASSRFPPSAC